MTAWPRSLESEQRAAAAWPFRRGSGDGSRTSCSGDAADRRRREAWCLETAVRSRRFSSWPSLWTGLRDAGAEAVDQEVVTDGQFTTSRSPADVPAFIEQFARTRAPG